MSNTYVRGLVRVRLYVTGCSPLVLTTYRGLRRHGFSRRDANLIIFGVILASGDGTVDVRSVGAR